MHQLFEFVSHHWLLAAAFIIALIALIIFEGRSRGLLSGGSRVTPARLVQLINKEKGMVLDIRPADQFSQGHILPAINVPSAELNQRLSQLEKYKQRPLIIACDLGTKSTAVSTQLKKLGFTHVYVLAGGLQAWKNAGIPLIKDTKKTS